VSGRQIGAPLILAIFSVAVMVLVTAWYAAKRLLSPKDIFGISDKRISRLGFFRSLAGLLTIAVATVRIRGANGFTADSILHITEALVIGVLSVFACIIFAVVVSRSRGALIARAWRPILKMALTFGPLFGADALGRLPTVTHLLNMKHPSIRAAFVVSSAGWLVLLAFWLVFFALWALYYSARYLYCAGEVHPLLAPLVTIVAVGILTAVEIARANRFSGPDTLLTKITGREKGPVLLHQAPPGLVLALTLGGCFTTTILAIFEWRSISTHNGIILREVPNRIKDGVPSRDLA
jgi:hypothetical protein